jgi:hypothetical protein
MRLYKILTNFHNVTDMASEDVWKNYFNALICCSQQIKFANILIVRLVPSVSSVYQQSRTRAADVGSEGPRLGLFHSIRCYCS